LFKARAVVALSIAIVSGRPAAALTFNLIDTGGAAIGTQARAGFDAAAGFWSSVLSNDVTINLDICFQALGAGILGSTSSSRAVLSMSQGYSALAASSTSTRDAMAVAGLQPLSASTILPGNTAVVVKANALNATATGYVDSATRIDQDGGINNSALAISRANAKALGITSDVNGAALLPGAIDGSITFSNSFAFDFNPTDGIDPAGYDFLGIAIHEIGHALGFSSGVDIYDAHTGPNGPLTGSVENLVEATMLDLFRYSAPGVLDWSTSAAPKYFSLDGGQTALFGDAYFALGEYNGDGDQASHWLDSPAGQAQLGIFDPTSSLGQIQAVTGLDLAAIDAIGWTIDPKIRADAATRLTTAQIAAADAVPEPAGWMMMIAGFGGIGGVLRRRKSRALSA
jgi:hypothetical protein